MPKYLLQKSDKRPLCWVLTDTENQIVCRFIEGQFNETQQITLLEDADPRIALAMPRIMREMADWLAKNHYVLVFTSPQLITQEARKDVGECIRRAREAKGLSLRQVEKLTGIAFNHIGRIERGKYNVTIDTLAVIANALGVRITFTDIEDS